MSEKQTRECLAKEVLRRELKEKYGQDAGRSDYLFDNAWDRGHPNGLSEVEHEYVELVRIFDKLAGKREAQPQPTPPQKTDRELALRALKLASRFAEQSGLRTAENYRFDLSESPQMQKIWGMVKEAFEIISETPLEDVMDSLPTRRATIKMTLVLTEEEEAEDFSEIIERYGAKAFAVHAVPLCDPQFSVQADTVEVVASWKLEPKKGQEG